MERRRLQNPMDRPWLPVVGLAALIVASALHAAEKSPAAVSVPETATVSETVPASETVPVPDAAPPDPAAIEHLRETGVTVKRVGVIGHDLRFWRVTDADGRQAFIATSREGFVIRGQVYSPDGSLTLDTEGSTPLYRSEPERRAHGLARLTGAPLQAETDLTWRRPNKPGAADTSRTDTPRTVWDQLGHATVIEEGKAGAPLVYCFFDPYCPYCHQQWNTLRKKVSAGTLRVRWVPVAVLTASQANLGVVGGLLADPRPETLSAWMRARRVRPDTSEATQRALGLNMALFQALKVPQVPASIYTDPTGRVIRKAGVADL